MTNTDSCAETEYHRPSRIKEIYQNRQLLKSLIVRNLIGRYKNSILGLAWHFITPIIMMVIYYVVFTEIRTNTLDNFWIFLCSGIFALHFMNDTLTKGAASITGNASMVNKMYFPREILVFAQVITCSVVMVIGYIITLLLMIVTGFPLTPYIALAPVFMISMIIFAIGYSLLFSSISVYVRDVQHFLSSIKMIFFFITPVYFSVSAVSENLRTLVWFNPYTYYVEAFHSVLYWGCSPSIQVIIGCILLPTITFIIGYLVFIKLSHGFTERL